jgi:hypothetical protein
VRKSKANRSRPSWLLAPALVSLLMAFLWQAIWLPQTARYVMCALEGEPTVGQVIDLAGVPNRYRETIHYVYNVGGQQFGGVGSSSYGNPSIDSTGPAIVTYARSDASVSCLGNHWSMFELLRTRLQGSAIVFVLTFAPVALAASGVGKWLTRWNRSGSEMRRRGDESGPRPHK